MGKDIYRIYTPCTDRIRIGKEFKIVRRIAALAISAVLAATPAFNVEAKEPYTDTIYRQLVTEKSNSACFESSDSDLDGYDVLADLVKIDDKDNLYDGAMLRNRGNWVLLQQGNKYTLIAENAYNINDANKVADEIVDTVKANAGSDATDRELFYEYLRYMAKNFHFSDEVSKNTTYMNKKGVIIDTDDFTKSYYKDKGINCAGYASLTYLVANKLGIPCEIIEGGTHVYNIVKFSDSDKYVSYDLTLQNKYAGLGILGNLLVKARTVITSDKKQMLTKACNSDKKFSSAGIGEYVKMFKYYHDNKAEQ